MSQVLEHPILWGILALTIGFIMVVHGVNAKFEMSGLKFRWLLTGIIAIILGAYLIISAISN